MSDRGPRPGPGAAVTVHGARYPVGVATLLAAGVCLSISGLLVRAIEAADPWLVLFYRSWAFFFTVLIFVACRYRGRLATPFRRIGWPGAAVALALGSGFSLYLLAVFMTTVANVVFTLAAGPFVAALLGWVVLRERVRGATWLAMVVAFVGVGVMFADGLGTGRMLGNLVALGAPLTFSVVVVAIRHAGEVDMMPATCLAGLVAVLIALPMVDGFAISANDLVLSILLGSAQIGAGFILVTLGSRHVPAAEVPLFALSETALAPLWVWLFVAEVPTAATLVGGAILMATVLAHGFASVWRERARAARARPTA